MRQHTLILLTLLAVAGSAFGATVTVRRDGTGDYLTLQPAFDAAADGDTVSIGPGEYTETTVIHPPGWPGGSLVVYGEIRQQRLTIVGAGAEATFIGPTVFAPNWSADSPWGLGGDGPKERWAVSDLTIRNCFGGMSFNCALQMERCHVVDNYIGVAWYARGSGGLIRDCRFSAVVPALMSFPIGLTVRGVGGVMIEDCEFIQGEPRLSSAQSLVRNCTMTGPNMIGLYAVDGVCTVQNCVMSDITRYGVITGYAGARCEIRDSDVSGDISAVLIDQRTSASIENSVLRGGSGAVLHLRDAEALTVTGCDFVRGSGPVVQCSRPAAWGAVFHDLLNNYWGTTDEAQIQAWIIDSVDDANIHATVHYSPFAGQSVPVESTTWGELKALWR